MDDLAGRVRYTTRHRLRSSSSDGPQRTTLPCSVTPTAPAGRHGAPGRTPRWVGVAHGGPPGFLLRGGADRLVASGGAGAARAGDAGAVAVGLGVGGAVDSAGGVESAGVARSAGAPARWSVGSEPPPDRAIATAAETASTTAAARQTNQTTFARRCRNGASIQGVLTVGPSSAPCGWPFGD
jgi:hypothetical protein